MGRPQGGPAPPRRRQRPRGRPAGDVESTLVVLKVMDRQARLFGLDAEDCRKREQAEPEPTVAELLEEADRLGAP